MSIELILNAVNINLVAFGAVQRRRRRRRSSPCSSSPSPPPRSASGLAIVLLIYRNRRSVDLDEVDADEGLRRCTDGTGSSSTPGSSRSSRRPRSSSSSSSASGCRQGRRDRHRRRSASCFAVARPRQWLQHVNRTPSTSTTRGARADGERGPEAEAADGRRPRPPKAAAEEAAAEAESRSSPSTGSCTWWSSGGIEFTVGTLVDGLAVMMLFVVTLDLAAGARLLHRLRRAATGATPTTSRSCRLFTASMLVLVIAREHAAAAHLRGSWSASARSCSSATGGRRSRTPTPPSRRSSPTASATSACSSA